MKLRFYRVFTLRQWIILWLTGMIGGLSSTFLLPQLQTGFFHSIGTFFTILLLLLIPFTIKEKKNPLKSPGSEYLGEEAA